METLKVVVSYGTGLDIHKKVIVASVFTPTLSETRSFGTLTDQLLALADWLIACGVTHVAMEATGVYWKPVVNVLESYDFSAVLVVNPQQIRGMPGRKTDVQDAQWIASLLRVGVLKGSYIPPRPQRELRELVRYRTSLVQTRAQEANRLQKVLEGANIKLSSVISDVLGVSGQRILAALAAGESDPQVLTAALHGIVQAHQRLMLKVQLGHMTFLDQQIATLSDEITVRLANFDDALTRLATIPGVGRRTAEILLAEVGTCSGFPRRPNSSRGPASARASTRVPATPNPPNPPVPARAARLCGRRWWRRGRPPARRGPTSALSSTISPAAAARNARRWPRAATFSSPLTRS